MLIGLTGLYCSGKSYVASLFEAAGVRVIDLDALGHEAIVTKSRELSQNFGEAILDDSGAVDRKKLAALVFPDKKKIELLESIIHPEVNRLTEKIVSENDGGVLVINAALLHKSVFFSSLPVIIIVRAPALIRLFRAKKRDQVPLHLILARMESQKTFASHYLKKNADIYYIYNLGKLGTAKKFFTILETLKNN